MTPRTSVFALPDRLAAKRDPALIAADERHFDAITENLSRTVAQLTDRLDAERRVAGGSGQDALERDLEIHRVSARLRALRRYGADLCLGRAVGVGSTYIGRFGLADAAGGRLLVDWRSPAAEPFFGATRAEPMGLATRRRYRWTGGRITDYWDEAFTDDAEVSAALDDESAFIMSLGGSRSSRMRDVLGTLQADQDAIIRAGSHGALVVDGGPGTGKTVVALHRAAYLLYADPRLSRDRGGVLFVGPSEAFLGYIDDVLPSLGEEGVLTATLRDLVPEGWAAGEETDARVAALKASRELVATVERAVRLHESPPAESMLVETDWADVPLTPDEWAEAFEAVDPGTPHDDARDEIWQRLLEIIADRFDGRVPIRSLDRSLRESELRDALDRAWPLLDPVELVASLWARADLLRRCAPGLGAAEIELLQRDIPEAWTTADLPLLDTARQLIGDPQAADRRRRRAAENAAERERMSRVIDDLTAADDSEMLVMSILRGDDASNSLDDREPIVHADVLAGPFAHILVDEAQELTDAEWAMLVRRCPSGSFTIVGDRAQARRGFAQSWAERLDRVGVDHVAVSTLTVNYRTPTEVMGAAEPIIRATVPDANVPTSVRSSGLPVVHGSRAQLDSIVNDWLDAHEGVGVVIGDPSFVARPRVRSLAPELAKGLEFDLVVLVDPERWSAVDRYVAMTRATQQLVVLTST